jgi:hypothetical protein
VRTSQSPGGPRISRRALVQGAGALGLSAAGSAWLGTPPARAALASAIRRAAWPRQTSAGHLLTNYLPSQPTGWPGQGGRVRDGVGVTVGGHVASLPFTAHDAGYEVSLLSFGQPGNAPDPVYEPEPADPRIKFKDTLQKAWRAYYAFRHIGGFSGTSAISMQSYSVFVTEPTAANPQPGYGMDVFLVYEPDPASSDPPITADLRWIQVNHAGGTPGTEFAQRACRYYFPAGLTSVYGKPAGSHHGGGRGGVGVTAPPKGKRPSTSQGPAVVQGVMAESFLVLDTGRKDRTGKGIIDIYGGVKWGYRVQAAAAQS